MHSDGMRPILGAVLVLITLAHLFCETSAHAPGEEFTYLNMFRKQATRGNYDTNALANSNGGFRQSSRPRTKHRRLHSSSPKTRAFAQGQGETEDEEYNQVPPNHRSRRQSRSILSAPKKSGEDDSDDSEEGDSSSSNNGKSNDQEESTEAEREGSDTNDEDASNASGSKGEDERPRAASKPVPFEGVGSQKDGEDIKRVSFMLMRLLKQYKAGSMVDVPCRAHSSWMHKLLTRVEVEIPGFKYYCVDTNKDILHALKERVKSSTENLTSKFVLRQFWNERLPRADVVFSWSGLEKMKRGNVLSFLKNVATSDRHKYIIIGNHMKGSKLPRKAGKPVMKPLNVRSEPFHLLQPLRVVSKLSVDPVKKQIYLYKTEEMRDGWASE